jgi:hypothetical protein
LYCKITQRQSVFLKKHLLTNALKEIYAKQKYQTYHFVLQSIKKEKNILKKIKNII